MARRRERDYDCGSRVVDFVDLVNLEGFEVGPTSRNRYDGRVRVSSYPPHIWTEFEGYQIVQTFDLSLGCLVGSNFCVRAMSRLSARTFRKGEVR